MSDQQPQGPDLQECAEYQAKTVRLRFLGQLCGALTGATFLGVLGVVGDALIKVHVATTAVAGGSSMLASIGTGLAIINPWTAGAFLAVGLVCAYLSTSFYQQAAILDSDFNAKKIAAATSKGKDSPETQVAVAIEGEQPEKPKNFPGLTNQSTNNATHDADQTLDLADDEAEMAPAADSKWTDKVAPANAGQKLKDLAQTEIPADWKNKIAAPAASAAIGA